MAISPCGTEEALDSELEPSWSTGFYTPLWLRFFLGEDILPLNLQGLVTDFGS